ncbi:hypothetical protein TELCIR_04818 [Teladorsagia circumcincta]|uniref:Neurotransmitter-gated ion-channel ligand binding domain protein n=1 Tax=Teladorsagia circumcincta TaxID=45464 RepID=A0A2G9USI3_TELCI|nr:hypothetical protein TELCIR_04818 [Teladorsagia circumcincta]
MLVRHLLENGYNANDRPVLNEKEAINLTISANSLSLLRMDQAEETATFSAEFILEWTDAFLKWNPDEHDGQRRVDDFPYDSQICTIDIGPWSYTDEEVHCTPGESIEGARDFYEGNSEWDFKALLASQKHSSDTDADFHFTEARFKLYVSRRPQFYLWVLLIPTFVITTVSIFGLFIPTNSLGDREEKVNLGLTTLLSSAVILEIVANSMPKASALPLLGNFILAEIFVVAVGVLFSVLTLTLHHRANTRRWRPKPWMLRILGVTGSNKFISKKCDRMKRTKNGDSRTELEK